MSQNIIPAVRDFFREYINAFLNTNGGALWLGVEDDSRVKGILINESQKSNI